MVEFRPDSVKFLNEIFPLCSMPRKTLPETPAAHDLRQRILDAAEALLESDGLGALSMREVARRSGVTHQAPYHHFQDRESILAALVTQGFDELTRRLARANQRSAHTEKLDALVESGQAYVGFAIDRPGLFRIMFRPELCDMTRFPAARQAGENAHGELIHMVNLHHGEGADAGLSYLYWAQVHGLACLIVDGPLGLQLTALAERRRFMRQSLVEFARRMQGAPQQP